MTDNSYGRGKRAHVPSEAIQVHLAAVQRTHATVENNRRKAAIKQQREDMAAEQAAKKQGPPAKTASKTTSGSSRARGGTSGPAEPPEVDPIAEELEADEAACKYLIGKITQRDKTRDVKWLDLHELEEIWEEMQRQPAAPVLKNPIPALKKNPQVRSLGTIDLATAPSKSTATAKRPLPKPVAHDPPRGSASSVPSKSITAPTKISRANSGQPPLLSKSTKPAPTSGVSSSIPRASGKPKHPPTTPNTRFEEIIFDDDDEEEDEPEIDELQEEEEPAEELKPKKSKGNRKAVKDYVDPVEQEIINVAYEHVLAKALKAGMCVPTTKLDPLIRECWNLALEELGVEEGEYAFTHQNRETIKTRLQSFRSHTRNRAFNIVPSMFGFHDKLRKEREACIAKLLPTEFLRNPKADAGGRFQHPFILDMLTQALLKGRKPPGERYPEYFQVVPLETIAFVCAMMQYALEQIQLCLPKADKMDFAKFQSRFNTHFSSLQTFEIEKRSRVQYIQQKLWKTMVENLGKESGLLANPSEPPQGALAAHEFDDKEEPTAEELAELGNLVIPEAEPSCRTAQKGKGKVRGPSVGPNDEDRAIFYDGSGAATDAVARTWSPPPVRPDGEDEDDAGPGPSTGVGTRKLRSDTDSESSSSSSESVCSDTGSDASEKRKEYKERRRRKERRKERRKVRREKRKERKAREAREREEPEGDESKTRDDRENSSNVDVDLPQANDKGDKPDMRKHMGSDAEMEDAAGGQDRPLRSPVGNPPKKQAVPGAGSGDEFDGVVANATGADAGNAAMNANQSSPIKAAQPRKRKMVIESDDEPELEPPAADKDEVEPDAGNKRAKGNAKGKQVAEGNRPAARKGKSSEPADFGAALRRSPRVTRAPARNPQIISAAARR
ncbi:hypothetical protein FS749_001364 [Ceratobasidium sp. UAMH 11750]|nr:hypothetical protein FS749_001364 [Ceratobasidium sp. UAMH 11750]